jgi:hypothetical protein
MSTSIISVLDRYPEAIRETIDLTFSMTSSTGAKYRRGLPDPALARFIPQNRYPATKLAFAKMQERRPTLASIVGVDGEYPLRREPVEFGIEMVGSVKLARARLLTEEDFDLLREAEMYLAANIPDLYNAFVERYTQIPAILTQAVTSLASLLLLQVFGSGAATYIDPETRLGFELSYLNQIPGTHVPLPLVGAAQWTGANLTTLAGAKPLENLRDHLNAYYGAPSTAGFGTSSISVGGSSTAAAAGTLMMPQAIAMTSSIAGAMLAAADTKLKIARFKGTLTDSVAATDAVANALPRPSIEDCRQWLANEITVAAQNAAVIPEIIISDAVYFTLGSDGRISPVPTPYLPTDRYVFLNEGIVEGAYVPTATNDYANTMALVTEEVSRAPKREKASIDTRFLALCTDPRSLGWLKVV